VDNLEPGDVCVIVDHPQIPPRLRWTIGRTVVLLATAGPDARACAQFCPYWRVSGLVNHKVSWVCLRKIPPEAADAAQQNETLAAC
jgi:hypothetical protein